MIRMTLIGLFSILATACSTMDHDMSTNEGMMSDKMTKPAMETSMDKKMDGMEQKKDTSMMSGDKM